MSFLKKYWREIVILLLIVAMLFAFQKCNQKDRDINLLEIAKDSALTAGHYYKTKNGDLVYQIRTYEVTVGQLKDYHKQLGIDNERLKNQVGSWKNIAGYYKVKASVRDTFTVTNTDTVYNNVEAKYFDWNNDHLHVQGIHTGKTTVIDYKYNFGFELIPYWKRKGSLGLGKSQLVTDIRFDDPNARVQEMKAVVITPPKRRWYETKGAALGVGLLAGFFLAR